MARLILYVFTAFLTLLWQTTVLANSPSSLQVDNQKVKNWNRFANDLYTLHQSQLLNRTIRTESNIGGYATHPDFYEETRYFDARSGVLLSRIQRERQHADRIHLIEVFVYDVKDQVQRDYLAVYLPDFRNAPIQTLINLHAHNKGLHAFRQFDASGERIYEQCKGTYKGKSILISLDEDQFLPGYYQKRSILKSESYQACFSGIAEVVDTSIITVGSARPSILALMEQDYDQQQVESKLASYTHMLEKNPKQVANLIARGNLYFVLHDYDLAIMDYSDAIRLDPSQHDAFFGRGMALARNGQVQQGIDDLSIYIKHHPDSSVAYTKRGVRYLWHGKDADAEADFRRAIELDPTNAEAHDDLGVILARRGDYREALAHFQQTVTLDPSYIKGYHNQAMVYYLTGQDTQALANIDKVLRLAPQARDSMLLKAEILERLGGAADAARLRQEAEFLPEGNWTERLSVQ